MKLSPNRKTVLRRYAIARKKDIELLHLHLILLELRERKFSPENIMGHRSDDFASSIQTIALAWFATLVDRSRQGLNVFELWLQLFPKHRNRIEEVRKRIEPAWKIIVSHRNRVAFHAAEPVEYFKTKLELNNNMNLVLTALHEFMGLSAYLMKIEDKELPELGDAAREMIKDINEQLGCNIDLGYFENIITMPPDITMPANK